jgi:hypothetical protein
VQVVGGDAGVWGVEAALHEEFGEPGAALEVVASGVRGRAVLVKERQGLLHVMGVQRGRVG